MSSQTGGSDEERLQALVMGLRTLEAYLNEVSVRESLVSRALTEAKAALEALKGLPSEGSTEVLVPLGAGVFLKTAAPPPDKLIISVGANVALEKDREGAEAYLNERIQELEKVMTGLQSQKAEITNRINATRSALSSLVQRQRAG